MASGHDTEGKRLHVAVVTDTYPPGINGVAMTLGRWCDGLRDRGHRVEVVRPGRSAGDSISGLPWWPLPGYWEIKVGAPWPGWFVRRWKRERPDVVYVAIETPLGFCAVAAARKLGIPVVGGFHTNFREYLRRYGVGWVADRVWSYQRWYHGRLDATVAPSPEAAERLETAGFSNVMVVGRGVDADLFHPAKRSAALRAEWEADTETPVALIVGRISSEKNIKLAMRAFDRMREENSNLKCIVVGDGPKREKLRASRKDLKFCGYQTGEALAACYASSDILLFPSETETFGNVLLEGMASGLAAVSYDYAASAWHVRHGENGLKVPKGDSGAFLKEAARLLDAGICRDLGREARRTAEQLSWPRILEGMEKVLFSVIR